MADDIFHYGLQEFSNLRLILRYGGICGVLEADARERARRDSPPTAELYPTYREIEGEEAMGFGEFEEQMKLGDTEEREQYSHLVAAIGHILPTAFLEEDEDPNEIARAELELLVGYYQQIETEKREGTLPTDETGKLNYELAAATASALGEVYTQGIVDAARDHVADCQECRDTYNNSIITDQVMMWAKAPPGSGDYTTNLGDSIEQILGDYDAEARPQDEELALATLRKISRVYETKAMELVVSLGDQGSELDVLGLYTAQATTTIEA